MPTLVRLLTLLIVIAGLVIAAMMALIQFVEPVRHPVSQIVPLRALGQGVEAPHTGARP